MNQAGVKVSTLVAIDSIGGFHAEIDPLGAELHRLRDGEGRDLLWDGDPTFWTGRAPILFPIVGALRDDGYSYRGRRYALPKHGFARCRTWALLDQQPDSATLGLSADDETRAAYPFDFDLRITFAVATAALAMTATVANTGDAVMPFSFGFHPALRWPFSAATRDDHRLRFDREERADIARIDAAGLVARREPTPVRGRDLPLADSLFTDDALIFAPVHSHGLDYGVPGGEQLRVEFPDFPDLGVWTKPGAGYLCLEPWLGHADPVEPYGEIFAKPGICTLQPGQSWQATMTISLQPAAA
ncbi:MAG: aldose 1-epimerase family protein [Sphingomonadales bacterium]|nr:aldose 1-epimerase family protein [Sphingomonadales bacterium]